MNKHLRSLSITAAAFVFVSSLSVVALTDAPPPRMIALTDAPPPRVVALADAPPPRVVVN